MGIGESVSRKVSYRGRLASAFWFGAGVRVVGVGVGASRWTRKLSWLLRCPLVGGELKLGLGARRLCAWQAMLQQMLFFEGGEGGGVVWQAQMLANVERCMSGVVFGPEIFWCGQ